MRNILCGFILGVTLLGLATSVRAQPDTLWSSRISMDGTVTLNGALDVGDGFVVVGTSLADVGNHNLLIAKLSLSGQVLWTNTLGTTRDEEGWGIASTPSGGFIVTGFGKDTNNRNVLLLAGVNATGDSLWWRSYGSGGQTKGRDIFQLSGGYYAVTGYRLGDNGSSSDVWLLKCTAAGDTLWTRVYGGDLTDVGYRLHLRPNGGFALAGTTASYGGGGDDAWLVVTDSSGLNSVNHAFGNGASEYGNAVTVNDAGEILLGGRGSSGGGPAFVAKCSSSGAILWSHFYDNEATAKVFGLVPRLGGGALCVGTDANGNGHPWFMGVDTEGNREWSWILDIDSTELNGAIPVASGGAFAFGHCTQEGYVLRLGAPAGISGTVYEVESGLPLGGVSVSTLGNGYATVTDAQGHFALERDPGTYTLYAYGPCVETDTFQTVQVFADSLVNAEISIGAPQYEPLQSSVNITAYNHQIASEPFLIENSGSGEMSFQIQMQAVAPPTPWLSADPASGTVPAGETVTVQVIVQPDTTDDGVWDYYGYLHLRTNSCPDSVDMIPVIVSVLDAGEPSLLPRKFALHAAYPNPFNPSTTLSFDLPRASIVRLAIYDVTGRLVRNLTDGAFDAGTHRVTFDASDLSTGVYLARFECPGFSAVQKLLLMK